jgi:hypothetical protein
MGSKGEFHQSKRQVTLTPLENYFVPVIPATQEVGRSSESQFDASLTKMLVRFHLNQ